VIIIQNEEVKLFCETCDKLICRDCTLVDHSKPEHKYQFVKQASDKHRVVIEQLQSKTKSQISNILDAHNSVTETKRNMFQKVDNIKQEIKHTFTTLHRALSEREAALLNDIDIIKQDKSEKLQSQINFIEFTLNNLDNSYYFTESILQHATEVELLSIKGLLTVRHS